MKTLGPTVFLGILLWLPFLSSEVGAEDLDEPELAMYWNKTDEGFQFQIQNLSETPVLLRVPPGNAFDLNLEHNGIHEVWRHKPSKVAELSTYSVLHKESLPVEAFQKLKNAELTSLGGLTIYVEYISLNRITPVKRGAELNWQFKRRELKGIFRPARTKNIEEPEKVP